MRSHPDHTVVRVRPPRALLLETGAMVDRGLAELKPRRVSYPKLAATAVRRMLYKSPYPAAETSLNMPLSGHDADLTLRLLGEMPSLMIGPALFPALLDRVAEARGRRIVVALGEGEAPRMQAHAELAKSLVAHDPRLEQRLAQALHARVRAGGPDVVHPAAFDLDHFVVEERPGRALVLNLAEPTLRMHVKRWQSLVTRAGGEHLRTPLELPEGWGVAAFVVAGEEAAASTINARTLRFASLDVRFATPRVDLDTAAAVRVLADEWLQGLMGSGLVAVARVIISVPATAVAAQFGACFAGDGQGPEIAYPDLVYGWQPLLTLVELLHQSELPALLVYTGRYPEIHLAAVW